MNKRLVFMGIVLVTILGMWIVYENWPVVQSETKIRKEILKVFPIGTLKSVIITQANRNFEFPSYRPQSPNQIMYRVSKVQGFVVVVVTWEFNEENQLTDIKVQKDYGP